MPSQELCLEVLPTRDRPTPSSTHIIQLNPKTMKKLNVKKGTRVLLTSASSIPIKYLGEIKNRKLRIVAKVYKPDERMGENEVRVDQTLRNAIGIPAHISGRERVHIQRHVGLGSSLLSRLITWILGVQDQVLRVHPSDTPAMEKQICLLHKEAMGIIGVGVGDFIRVESPYSKPLSLRVLELTDQIKRRREQQIENDPDRYPPCSKYLKLGSPDLPWILMDWHARDALKVDVCDPVIVRRDALHILYKNLNSFAILLLVTLIGASLAIEPVWAKAIVFGGGIATSLLLILYRIRKEVIP